MDKIKKDLQIEFIKFILSKGETLNSICRNIKTVCKETLYKYVYENKRPKYNKYCAINAALKQCYKFEYDMYIQKIIKEYDCNNLDEYLLKRYKETYIGE